MALDVSQNVSAGLVDSLEPAGALESAESPVEILAHRQSVSATLREAWRCRHVLWELSATVVSRILSKYRLGASWLFFNSFMSLIGYTLIFGGGVFNVKTPNGMPYFLFTMVGMMGWNLFQQSLMVSTRSFQWLKTVVRDVHFPLMLVPIAGSARAVLQFLLYLIGYVGAIIYFWATRGKLYAQLDPKYLLMSVAGLFLCLLLAWGVGMWTSALTAWARDVRVVIKYIVPFWMLVTPVLYPIEHLQGKTRLVAELNPLASPVELAKVGLLGAGSVRVFAAIWSVGVIVLIFLSGVWFVSRYGHTLASAGGTDDLDDDL